MTKICPKCNNEMERGAIMTGSGYLASWCLEEAAKLKAQLFNRKSYTRIYAYKCKACGFIEHYVDVQKDN